MVILFSEFVDKLNQHLETEEDTLMERDMNKSDFKRLESLWKDFLSKSKKSGFIPKPNQTIGFRDINKSDHDVGGRTELKTPTRKELGLKTRFKLSDFPEDK